MPMFGGMYQGPQNWGDRLAIIGAALKDASPNSQGGNLSAAQQMLMQRQMAQYQMGMMGRMAGLIKPPQDAQYQDGPPPPSVGGDASAPVTTQSGQGAQPPADAPTLAQPYDISGAATRAIAPSAPASAPQQPWSYRPPIMTAPARAGGLNLLDPETQQTLSMAAAVGLPGAKEMIDLGKAVMPQYDAARPGTQMYDKLTGRLGAKVSNPQYVNDQLVDPTSPNAPGFVPKYQPMTMPDGRGGVMAMRGAADTMAALAGATTNAQQSATAAYDLVPVPQSDGTTRLLPRSVALGAVTGQSRNLPQIGAPGAAASGGDGSAPQFGVSQSPAAKALADARAATQAEREKLQPQQTGAMADLENRSKLTTQIIHQILGDVQDPKTGQYKPGGHSMIRPWTVGIGANLAHVDGTPAHDLEAQLDHIRAMTSLDELQKLREESPTGAGLGRVTQQEIDLLAAMRGSIDQGQSGGQMKQNLRRQLQQLDAIRANRHQIYQSTYGNIQQPTPGATAPIPPGQSPSRTPTLKAPNYTITAVRRGSQ